MKKWPVVYKEFEEEKIFLEKKWFLEGQKFIEKCLGFIDLLIIDVPSSRKPAETAGVKILYCFLKVYWLA